jgi:hypothetical protein
MSASIPSTKRGVMAPELWREVVERLPSLSLTPAFLAFGKRGLSLRDAEKSHSRIWNMIFEEKFTSKVQAKGFYLALLGKNLEYLYNSKPRFQNRKTKLILLIGVTKPRGCRLTENDIFNCLKPITDPRDKLRHIVTLKDSNITLDLRAALGRNRLDIQTPADYFSLHRNCVDSFYIYWNDSQCKLRNIGSRDFLVYNKNTDRLEPDRNPQKALRGKDENVVLVIHAPDGKIFRQLFRIYRG